jgi:hypothetical protein
MERVAVFVVAQYKHKRHDHLIFYDSWVSRDLAGIPFSNSRPFLLHQARSSDQGSRISRR